MPLLPQRCLILILLNAVYFFVYFHRVATAVLAPYLMEAFSASGASLGAMSSAYFYPYALSQPLVGVLTDRWGARKVITLCAFIESVGALLFGLAPNLFLAAVGRGLIGLGAAGVFVPALKVLLPWFGARMFGQMNAVLLAVGNMGAIAASTPFAWLIQKIGWRACFFLFAALIFFLGLLSRRFIENTPPGYAPPPGGEKPVPPSQNPGLAVILKSPFFWTMGALFFAYGGPLSTFQGLWGYPFLVDVFGYDKLEAGNLIMAIALGVIFGGPVLGFLTDRTFSGHKGPLLSICLGVQALGWAAVVFLSPRLGPVGFVIVFFIMGTMFGGTLSAVWAIVREELPADRLGTAMGFLNPAPFLGVAVFQPVTGYLMDRVGRVGGAFPLRAYQHAFLLCLFSVFVALAISVFMCRQKRRG